jgi:hypothetical protein
MEYRVTPPPKISLEPTSIPMVDKSNPAEADSMSRAGQRRRAHRPGMPNAVDGKNQRARFPGFLGYIFQEAVKISGAFIRLQE